MVHGKRNKRQEVPIADALDEELAWYQVAFGLPDEVLLGEDILRLMAANAKRKRASNSIKAMIDVIGRSAALG